MTPLNDSEKRVCKLLGLTPDQFAAHSSAGKTSSNAPRTVVMPGIPLPSSLSPRRRLEARVRAAAVEVGRAANSRLLRPEEARVCELLDIDPQDFLDSRDA